LVEVSLDGKKWDVVGQSTKKDWKLSTAEGYTFNFKQRKVRHIRVTITGHSVNNGVAVVEVKAFAK